MPFQHPFKSYEFQQKILPSSWTIISCLHLFLCPPLQYAILPVDLPLSTSMEDLERAGEEWLQQSISYHFTLLFRKIFPLKILPWRGSDETAAAVLFPSSISLEIMMGFGPTRHTLTQSLRSWQICGYDSISSTPLSFIPHRLLKHGMHFTKERRAPVRPSESWNSQKLWGRGIFWFQNTHLLGFLALE